MEKNVSERKENINSEVETKIVLECETKDDYSDQKVTPWEVSSTTKIDYMRLVKQFGTELIDNDLLEKFKRVTGKELHPWLRRGIFFSHRELSKFLDAYENGEPVFLYTGRGPTSDAMHVGHLIPFLFCKWLQDVFDCPMLIQIADEEKAAFKKIPFELLHKMGFENAKDIIACGFNPEKTFIYSNRDYRLQCPQYESFTSEMKMKVPMKVLQDIFGLDGESTIAMYDWPFYQTAAAFYQGFPHLFGTRPAYCLIPYAIDQDPYFRMARDIATKMNLIKPACIMCTFIPPLTGLSGKMSSSVGIESTLFLTDDEQTLRQKVLKYSFSGGGGNGTTEDHRKYGGNPEVDIAYQYLRYFEEDDETLKKTHDLFKSGEMLCGELKQIMVEKLIPIVNKVRNSRKNVTDDVLNEFYKLKKMELPKPKEKVLEEPERNLYELLKTLEIEYRTKYHALITTTEEAQDLANSIEGTLCKIKLLKGPKDAYFAYILNSATTIDTKTLKKKLNVNKLSFAQNDNFTQFLKLPITCPSVFGLINDNEKSISSVLIQESIPKDKPVNFNPMRPDATTTISYTDMIKFLEYLKYPIQYVQE